MHTILQFHSRLHNHEHKNTLKKYIRTSKKSQSNELTNKYNKNTNKQKTRLTNTIKRRKKALSLYALKVNKQGNRSSILRNKRRFLEEVLIALWGLVGCLSVPGEKGGGRVSGKWKEKGGGDDREERE